MAEKNNDRECHTRSKKHRNVCNHNSQSFPKTGIFNLHPTYKSGDNLMQSRITQRIGLYALGKTSTKIKREVGCSLNDENEARAKEDLDKLLQLVNKGPKLGNKFTTPTQSTSFIVSNDGQSSAKRDEKKLDWNNYIPKSENASLSQTGSLNEDNENLLNESEKELSKDLELQLLNILENEDINLVQDTKMYLQRIHQQRSLTSNSLFTENDFKSECTESLYSSPETFHNSEVVVPDEVTAFNINDGNCFHNLQDRAEFNIGATVSNTFQLPKTAFHFSPKIEDRSFLYAEKFPPMTNNFSPTIFTSSSMGSLDTGELLEEPPVNKSSLASPFVSPLPRFYPHRI